MRYLARTTCFAAVVGLLIAGGPVFADRIDELEDEIEEKQEQIGELEKDIEEYQGQLQVIGKEKRTLETAVAELGVSRRKLGADIGATEVKIDETVLSIEKLTLEIEDKRRRIVLNSTTIGETIRAINEADSQSLVEQVLAYDNLSDFWVESEDLSQFQVALSGDLRQLYELEQELDGKRRELNGERDVLSALRTDLVGKKGAVDAARNEKDSLLTRTESEEAAYQALLAEKVRLRDAFLAELQAIEDELRITIDPNSLPSSGSGVLKWPLDSVVITQYFGNTSFATQNPQIYRGAGHNGIDLSAARGTRVKAALAGTVSGFGNTDAVSGCYSYGKWILIKHNNGLSTLYAHLDSINVSSGQIVGTGEVIGYSGNTGYSTGPHLHFTVYASEGVRIQSFTTSINCKNASIPIAPKEAYLNPLSYL